MSQSTLLAPKGLSLSAENLYTLSITSLEDKTQILMTLLIPKVNTREFPQTRHFLKLYLPSIFTSTCYNDDKLPFHKEVASTEVGHLFEHVMLEFLCLIKLEKGHETVSYEGVTDWNWIKDPKGTFHITIFTPSNELGLFNEALEKTVKLMNVILSQEKLVETRLIPPETTTKH